MARGGIYDQLGGGFHRYSVDQVWLVPHFEKMLYDKAQLALLYLQAWQATGDPEYRRVTEETLDYVVREMTHPEGGFYSTQDADSEGEEGRFFLWDPAEIEALLDPETGPGRRSTTGVWPTAPTSRAGASSSCPAGSGRGGGRRWASRRAGLGDPSPGSRPVCSQHPRGAGQAGPGREGAGRLERHDAPGLRRGRRARLERPDYLEVAERNARLPPVRAASADGRLLRTWKDGRAKLLGYLEDHAMVADGLLALHEATLDQRWLGAARGLADAMLDLFWDPEAQGFFDTGRDHEALVVRPRSLFDSAVPCGSSVAADVLLRLAVLTGDADLERRARGHAPGGRAPHGAVPLGVRALPGVRWTSTSGSPVEVAVVWAGDSPPAGREPLSRRFWRRSSAATSRTGSSPEVPRDPLRTCRSWPASGPGPAGRPRTSARGTHARRPRPSRRTWAASWTGAAAAGPGAALIRVGLTLRSG